MGNKLCKKKSEPDPKSPFDRIINRLHLRPNSWKSESQLTSKPKPQNLSKSTNALEDADESVILRNPKLEFIFDNQDGTPVPPPRKHRKGIREKIESVAKTGLQAFQHKKPVDEPLFVKKIVKQTCPLDEHDCALHNKAHHHENGLKEKKNLSVVSLPNYAEKNDGPKPNNKLESAMTRCRSFGSLLPQQLLGKLKIQKIPLEAESDDSFGPLEDWDLKILEHYNPKDASLPRQSKPVKKEEVLSGIESLIEAVEDVPEKKNVDVVVEEVQKIEDHSSLMKILQEYSVKDKQSKDSENEIRKKIDSVEDFLKNEQMYCVRS